MQSKLEWFQLKNGNDDVGEILACFELFSLDKITLPNIPALPPKTGALFRVSPTIRPHQQRTMIEILAWGLRNMKSFQLSDIDRPQVIFECGERTIETEIIKNLKKNPNFVKPVIQFDIVNFLLY
jgi:dysferlin